MTFRIAWKPYLYSQTLPHLLGGVTTPALVVWGAEDRIVPRSVGERYARSLPHGRLEIVEGAGHCVEMERPSELVRLIDRFSTETEPST
jgi:pimeloyl-ACP methyl ester carboxylesterase